ncbi:MAG: bifunctional UDP-N-acetylglucosamine diphosphorylase/glucosamine-1-phosphate N-acetyltransferase GlmU [Acidobacteria bacterium]|nr:bifunctional UDP-N-acetylglucosamine diphosphorylase/glucosamine-1-phosphate N-acetyltransferase GlmU [Acidobacteriota bacterium]
MTLSPRHVIVLAAGKGTRMRAARPKVLHRIGGHPLVGHVLDAAAPLRAVTTTVIVGHQAEAVEAAVSALGHPRLRFVRQEPQAGTAHALLQAERALAGARGTLVVLSGDAPLVRAATLAQLVEHHEARGAAATVVTAVVERPYGYGRVVRLDGALVRVVEEADASPEQRRIREVNAGIYAFDLAPLFGALHAVPEAGPKQERYLPAILSRYRRRGLTVETVAAPDAREVRGVNSQAELAELGSVMRQVKNEELMASGVTIEDPATTYIDRDVRVGPDTVIHPGVTLEGRTVVGARCELRSGVRITDSTLGDDVVVNDCSVVVRSEVAAGARVGPFAHLRPESTLGAGARVGAFVEVKRSTLGDGAKANHLSYLGDATLAAGVNVGAGTITCNYDGESKHPTKIEEGAFIGSGTELVAPVTVGRGAYVAAGSCITEDVPAGALGVARGRQANKAGWAAKRNRRPPETGAD